MDAHGGCGTTLFLQATLLGRTGLTCCVLLCTTCIGRGAARIGSGLQLGTARIGGCTLLCTTLIGCNATRLGGLTTLFRSLCAGLNTWCLNTNLRTRRLHRHACAGRLNTNLRRLWSLHLNLRCLWSLHANLRRCGRLHLNLGCCGRLNLNLRRLNTDRLRARERWDCKRDCNNERGEKTILHEDILGETTNQTAGPKRRFRKHGKRDVLRAGLFSRYCRTIFVFGRVW